MAGETRQGKSQFRKWKTGSGVIVCARAELSLPDSFIDRVLLTEDELQKVGTGSGRGSVRRSQLPNGEYYVLRPFRRGGMMQTVTKDTFLTLPIGPLRPMLELEVLSTLYDRGIPVPKPLFAIVQYGMLNLAYSCAIATAELHATRNFMDVAQSLDEESKYAIAYQAGFSAGRSLVAGVFHRDLHLGNVLFRSAEDVYLIDFDKAMRIDIRSIPRFSDRLRERWDRSVRKHRVGLQVSSSFNDGLHKGIGESLKQKAIDEG